MLTESIRFRERGWMGLGLIIESDITKLMIIILVNGYEAVYGIVI